MRVFDTPVMSYASLLDVVVCFHNVLVSFNCELYNYVIIEIHLSGVTDYTSCRANVTLVYNTW